MKRYKIIYQHKGKLIKINADETELEYIKKSKNIIKIKEHKRRKKVFVMKSIKESELLNIFSQIDMILQADITLYEALEIISKSYKDGLTKELLLSMKNALKSGKPIYTSFIGFEKYIDEVIISFFRISHMKGNTSLIVSSLCKVLNLKKANKDLIFSSLSYPLVIFLFFIAALTVIFIFVIPKFEYIFTQYNLILPIYTILLLGVKNFLINYFFMIIMVVSLFLLYIKVQYKNKRFRYRFDKVLIQKIPLISKIHMSYQLYSIFICMNVLMKSRYEFNVALENSALLLKNKYLLDKIETISKYINNGLSIYDSFEKAKLFDEVVLNLLNSGEKSSKIEEALERIEQYYKYKFTKSIKRFSSLIEPIFFAIMMLLILWVMLAIFTPIWNMSEMLNV